MVSPDPRFRDELESALASLDELHPVIHHANDIRQAIEAARSRRPQIALVEMGSDVRPLQAFAEEAAVVSPETVVAAVFRPDVFDPDVPESTILIQAIRAGVKDFLRPRYPAANWPSCSAASSDLPLGKRAAWAASFPSSAIRAAWENPRWPSMRAVAWPCVTRGGCSWSMRRCSSALRIVVGSRAHHLAQRRRARGASIG